MIRRHFGSIACWLFSALMIVGMIVGGYTEAPKLQYPAAIDLFIHAGLILASIAGIGLMAGFILRYKPDGPVPDKAGYNASSIGFGGSGLIFALLLLGTMP